MAAAPRTAAAATVMEAPREPAPLLGLPVVVAVEPLAAEPEAEGEAPVGVDPEAGWETMVPFPPGLGVPGLLVGFNVPGLPAASVTVKRVVKAGSAAWPPAETNFKK